MSDIKLFRIAGGAVNELAGTTDTVEKSRACAPLLPVILENLEDSLRLPVAALFVRLAVEGLSDAAVATTMLRTALAGAVSSPDVRYGRPFARWLMRLGRLEQARDVLVRLREAVEEDADLTQTRSALWHDLGQTYSVTDLKERSHALHAYQQAAKLDPLSGSAASSLTALRSLASAASLANASEDVTWAASRALQLLHRLPDEPNVLLHLYELAVAAETHGADEAAGGMFVHLLGASVLALLTELPAVMSLRLTPAQEHLEQAVQTYARAAVRLRRRPSRDAVAASLALWDLLDDLVAGRTARALRGITNARRTLTKTLQGDSLPTEVADAYVTVFDSILTNLNAQQDISPGLPLRGADGDARTIALPDGAVYG